MVLNLQLRKTGELLISWGAV